MNVTEKRKQAMIRTALVAMILRSTGYRVVYVLRRNPDGNSGSGRTVLKTNSLKAARKKFNAMRIADTDSLTITLTAVVGQRHGEVHASGDTK